MEKSTKVKQNFISKKNSVRAGEFWSVNTKKINGHKSEIGKRKKNGSIDVVVLTHAKRTFGKKNIPLQENPQPNDSKPAYVVKNVQHATINDLGKQHSDIKITNPIDKSIIRKIKSK